MTDPHIHNIEDLLDQRTNDLAFDHAITYLKGLGIPIFHEWVKSHKLYDPMQRISGQMNIIQTNPVEGAPQQYAQLGTIADGMDRVIAEDYARVVRSSMTHIKKPKETE